MNTDIYTYFTKATGVSELLYSAEEWMKIRLVLETAGPVSVGTRESVTPVLSGKGILLESDGEPIEFTIPKGNRLFIASESVNRVKVIIEPIPWLEQLLYQVESGFSGLKGVLGAALRGGGRKSSAPQTPGSDCPPAPTIPNIWKGRK